MSEPNFRPRWVGPAYVLFSLGVAGLILGGIGFGASRVLTGGPSAEEVFFAETLPSWWVSKAKGETLEGELFEDLPDEGLRAPLERIGTLLGGEPQAVAVEALTLNQAIEEAGLPFFVDVVVRGPWPLLLTFRVERRDLWARGEDLQDVVVASRLDRTNVVTAFTGRKGNDLPVVLLDRIESGILRRLRQASSDPVSAFVRDRMLAFARDAAPGFRPEAAIAAAQGRETAIAGFERRRQLRIRRPERFDLPDHWLETFEELGERALTFRAELDRVRAAQRKLSAPAVRSGLDALRRALAEVGSAHQLHVALSPDFMDAEPPPELRRVYGDEATDFRAGGHLHMLAALGAIRDSSAPACLALLRALEGAAGPHRRATAWYYGTLSALLALFESDDLSPAALAARAEAACEGGDNALRARAAQVLEREGVPKAELRSSSTGNE